MKTKIFYVSIILISIFLTFTCKEKSTITNSVGHTEAIGMVIYYNGNPFLRIKNGKIDSTVSKGFNLKLNQILIPLEVKFIDEGGDEIIPEESEKNLGWIIDDTTIAELTLLPAEKWKFQATGKKIGSTLIEFRLNHIDHPDFKTPKIPLVVLE